MTQWRIFSALYLIGVFRTTLYLTIIVKISDLTLRESYVDGFYNWQIYTSIVNVGVSISIVTILYLLTKKEQNADLTYIRDRSFVKELMKYFIIYIIGYLTLSLILLIRYNISGEDATTEFYNDIISIYGLVDFGNLTLGIFINDQFRYILVIFLQGMSASIIPLVIIMTSNIFNSRSITKYDGEALYPKV